MLVVGDREMEAGEVSLRLRSGENPGALSVEAFINLVAKDIQSGI
jgi:threonyl-tRNA synthetase